MKEANEFASKLGLLTRLIIAYLKLWTCIALAALLARHNAFVKGDACATRVLFGHWLHRRRGIMERLTQNFGTGATLKPTSHDLSNRAFPSVSLAIHFAFSCSSDCSYSSLYSSD